MHDTTPDSTDSGIPPVIASLPKDQKPITRPKYTLFIKFKDQDPDEEPLEIFETADTEELQQALEKIMSWPLLGAIREIDILIEEEKA